MSAELLNIGMVSDANWADFNGDGWMDFVLLGEWMAPRFFMNMEGKFQEIGQASGVNDQIGWWTSLVSGDFDNDGDTDFIAGNWGTNCLYHGTPEKFLSSIFEEGLTKQARHHVHLSTNIPLMLEVARRRGPASLLEIDAKQMHNDGYTFYVTKNDVWLTDHIPTQYLKQIDPVQAPKT